MWLATPEPMQISFIDLGQTKVFTDTMGGIRITFNTLITDGTISIAYTLLSNGLEYYQKITRKTTLYTYGGLTLWVISLLIFYYL